METAHAYFKKGSFYTGPEHIVPDDERTEYWEREADKLFSWAKAVFPRGSNLEYALLKGHLILERALGFWIRSHSSVLIEEHELKFTFRQKLDIAYLMGFGVNDATVMPTIERWNSLRNAVAHSFDLDRKHLDEMIRIISDDYDLFAIETDRQRVSYLRRLCYYVCGRIAGESSAHTWFDIARSDAYVKMLDRDS